MAAREKLERAQAQEAAAKEAARSDLQDDRKGPRSVYGDRASEATGLSSSARAHHGGYVAGDEDDPDEDGQWDGRLPSSSRRVSGRDPDAQVGDGDRRAGASPRPISRRGVIGAE
jgi:hypothetical protein